MKRRLIESDVASASIHVESLIKRLRNEPSNVPGRKGVSGSECCVTIYIEDDGVNFPPGSKTIHASADGVINYLETWVFPHLRQAEELLETGK